jgi:hypothetical protein
MPEERNQDDATFLHAIDLGDDVVRGRRAILFRAALARFGQVDSQTLRADQTIAESGIIHPADSLDLLEFTFALERDHTVRFDPTVLSDLLPRRENTTIGEWTRKLADYCADVGTVTIPCPHCAYNLRSIRSSRCPECGRPTF